MFGHNLTYRYPRQNSGNSIETELHILSNILAIHVLWPKTPYLTFEWLHHRTEMGHLEHLCTQCSVWSEPLIQDVLISSRLVVYQKFPTPITCIFWFLEFHLLVRNKQSCRFGSTSSSYTVNVLSAESTDEYLRTKSQDN